MKKLFLLLTMVLPALFACEQTGEEKKQQYDPGSLMLQMEMQYIAIEVHSLSGLLSRVGFETIEFNLDISNQAAYALVPGVVDGTWLLEVYACDGMGTIVYTGSTEVEVIAGQITPVHLDLLNTGSLEITVTWGGGEPPTDDDWFSISLSAPHIGSFCNTGMNGPVPRWSCMVPTGICLQARSIFTITVSLTITAMTMAPFMSGSTQHPAGRKQTSRCPLTIRLNSINPGSFEPGYFIISIALLSELFSLSGV